MDNLEEVVRTAEEVLGKWKSHQLFQSKWDTAAFIIFLIFVGTVSLLLLLACLHCCCCSRCQRHRSSGPQGTAKQENSMGVNNLALEP
ncbi:small integral membrane protein 22 [Molossus molossus]|uniref:Small integral membrane protein 22 n=1 Tax=Molossus molossus TaxID=27622 RepID=A0A7J8J2B6_MOLMO|nr:small integral membrane protein 22 [Molossus molossus]KAF6491036.1 small integral membrane protein 22 [Molossus molossus]